MVKICDKKTAENCGNCFNAEKKKQFPNHQRYRSQIFDGTNERLESRFASTFHVPIFDTFRDIGRQRASRSGRAGSWF